MRELICIVCPLGCHLQVDDENGCAVTGNACPRGAVYGKKELQNPTRTVTSTVRIAGAHLPRLPVKTDREIPKADILPAMRLLDEVQVQAPVQAGDVVVPDILGTGASFVATRSLPLAEHCDVPGV